NLRPLDTVLRFDVKLSGGAHCLRATCVVERVEPEPEPGMTLWLLAADDPGRELIAWMGGSPPPILKESTPDAARPAEPAAPAQGDAGPAAQASGSDKTAADASGLGDALTASAAAAAAADRAAHDPAPPPARRTTT